MPINWLALIAAIWAVTLIVLRFLKLPFDQKKELLKTKTFWAASIAAIWAVVNIFWPVALPPEVLDLITTILVGLASYFFPTDPSH
jgi:hypothetical protein